MPAELPADALAAAEQCASIFTNFDGPEFRAPMTPQFAAIIARTCCAPRDAKLAELRAEIAQWRKMDEQHRIGFLRDKLTLGKAVQALTKIMDRDEVWDAVNIARDALAEIESDKH